MTNHPQTPRPINDVPLPGFVECLTLQLNVTLHRKSGTAKYVAIVRDPNDPRTGEVSRTGGNAPWQVVDELVVQAVTVAIASMIYLCDLPVES